MLFRLLAFNIHYLDIRFSSVHRIVFDVLYLIERLACRIVVHTACKRRIDVVAAVSQIAEILECTLDELA